MSQVALARRQRAADADRAAPALDPKGIEPAQRREPVGNLPVRRSPAPTTTAQVTASGTPGATRIRLRAGASGAAPLPPMDKQGGRIRRRPADDPTTLRRQGDPSPSAANSSGPPGGRGGRMTPLTPQQTPQPHGEPDGGGPTGIPGPGRGRPRLEPIGPTRGGTAQTTETGGPTGDVPVETTDGASITAGVGGFLWSLKALYLAIERGEPQEKVRAGYSSVVKSGGLIKASMQAAEHSGAALATGAIPGVGLAWSVLSLIGNVTSLVQTYQARDTNGDLLAKETDETARLAFTRIERDLNAQVANYLVQIAGDIAGVVGGGLTLGLGPVGIIVSLAGALVKVAGTAAKLLADRSANSNAEQLHNEHDQATLSGNRGRLAEARKALIPKDSEAAIREIVRKATTIAPGTDTGAGTDTETGTGADGLDPEMAELLGRFGVGATLLGEVASAARSGGGALAAVQERVVDQMLLFVGASRFEPRGLAERLSHALTSVDIWFDRKAAEINAAIAGGPAGSDWRSQMTDDFVTGRAMLELRDPVRAYFAICGPGSSQEARSLLLTNALAKTFRDLQHRYVTGLGDVPAEKKAARMAALELGLRMVVEEQILDNDLDIPLEAIQIGLGGKVYFPPPDRTAEIRADVELVATPIIDGYAAEIAQTIRSGGSIDHAAKADALTVRLRPAVAKLTIKYLLSLASEPAERERRVDVINTGIGELMKQAATAEALPLGVNPGLILPVNLRFTDVGVFIFQVPKAARTRRDLIAAAAD